MRGSRAHLGQAMSEQEGAWFGIGLCNGANWPVVEGGYLRVRARAEMHDKAPWWAAIYVSMHDPVPEDTEQIFVDTEQRLADDLGRVWIAHPCVTKFALLDAALESPFGTLQATFEDDPPASVLANHVCFLDDTQFLSDRRHRRGLLVQSPKDPSCFRVHALYTKYLSTQISLWGSVKAHPRNAQSIWGNHIAQALIRIRQGSPRSDVAVEWTEDDFLVHQLVDTRAPDHLGLMMTSVDMESLLLRQFASSEPDRRYRHHCVVPATFERTDETCEPNPMIEYVPPR